MGLLRKMLGGTRVYRALSTAYDEHLIASQTTYTPSQFARYGANIRIERRVAITHPGRVAIGDWTTIQAGTLINSMGGLHVGRYVGIGYRCIILTFLHNYRNSAAIPFDDGVTLKPVVIRDFGWVGWGSMVLPGIEIGEGAIVGLGAVVSADVPPLAIVMGNPAKVIGFRSREHFESCKAEGRLNPHRILEVYGNFRERIPPAVQRRFGRELRELGMIE